MWKSMTMAIACVAAAAAGQVEYDWTLRTRDERFSKDPNVAVSARHGETHIRTLIERIDDHTLEVAILSLRMDVPNAPGGPLSFDSQDEPDSANALETGLRPLIGHTFTVVHDPESGLIASRGAILDLSGSKAVAGVVLEPWLTPSYLPFFASDPEASFSVLPVAINETIVGGPAPVDWSTDTTDAGATAVSYSFDHGLKQFIESRLSRFENTNFHITGTGSATIEEGTVESVDYIGSTVLSFDVSPERPARVVIKVEVAMRRAVEEQSPGVTPTEAVEATDEPADQ